MKMEADQRRFSAETSSNLLLCLQRSSVRPGPERARRRPCWRARVGRGTRPSSNRRGRVEVGASERRNQLQQRPPQQLHERAAQLLQRASRHPPRSRFRRPPLRTPRCRPPLRHCSPPRRRAPHSPSVQPCTPRASSPRVCRTRSLQPRHRVGAEGATRPGARRRTEGRALIRNESGGGRRCGCRRRRG